MRLPFLIDCETAACQMTIFTLSCTSWMLTHASAGELEIQSKKTVRGTTIATLIFASCPCTSTRWVGRPRACIPRFSKRSYSICVSQAPIFRSGFCSYRVGRCSCLGCFSRQDANDDFPRFTSFIQRLNHMRLAVLIDLQRVTWEARPTTTRFGYLFGLLYWSTSNRNKRYRKVSIGSQLISEKCKWQVSIPLFG